MWEEAVQNFWDQRAPGTDWRGRAQEGAGAWNSWVEEFAGGWQAKARTGGQGQEGEQAGGAGRAVLAG